MQTKTPILRTFTVALSLLLTSCFLANATDIVWTNASGGNWSVIQNWSPNLVPGLGDNAFMTNGGGINIQQDATINVGSMTVGGPGGESFTATQALTLSSASLVTAQGQFVFAGGNLNGPGVLTVAGNFIWDGGVIYASGIVQVAQGGTFTAASSGSMDCAGVITNAGTIFLTSGPLRFADYSSFGGGMGLLVNETNATINFQSDATLDILNDGSSGNVPEVVNWGTIEKTAGTGVSSINPPLYNYNLVDAQTGTINCTGGGESGASFQAEAGATMAFAGSGDYILDPTGMVLGGGTVAWNAGTFTLNGTAATTYSILDGGVLQGTNGLLSSACTWSAGIIGPAARLTIGTNGSLSVTGGGQLQIAGELTNAGTISLTSASVRCIDYSGYGGGIGLLINQPSGMINFEGDQTIDVYNDGSGLGAPEVINNGLVVKSTGTGVSAISTPFYNYGTLDAQTGTISCNGGGEGNGIFRAEAPGTTAFGASYILDSAGVLSGAGTNAWNGGTFTLNGQATTANSVLAGGVLQGSNGVLSGVCVWTAGIIGAPANLMLATNGTIMVESGGTADMSGVLTNAGTIDIVSGGLRCIAYAGYGGGIGLLANLDGGTINIQADQSITVYNDSSGFGAPSLINFGLVVKSVGTGISYIQPPLYNHGTVDAQTGTIAVSGGGDSDGVFRAEAAGTTAFDGDYTLDASGELTGAGTNAWNTGTFTLNGSANTSNSTLAGGFLGGSNGTISGTCTWSGGVIVGSANLTLATNGTLILVDGGLLDFAGILTNNGTIDLASANLRCIVYSSYGGGTALLVISPGGTINFQADEQIALYNDGSGFGTPLVINNGLMVKSGGAGISYIYPALTNSGTLSAQTGTLNPVSYFPELGSTLNSGLSNTTNFGVIALNGANALQGNLSANFLGGYWPSVGDSWSVVTYGSATGDFGSTNLPPVAVWQVNQSNTALSITVLKLVPQLSWPAPAAITYGAALTGSQLNPAASWNGSPVAGAFVYNPPLTTVLASGSNQTLSATFTPSDPTTYTNVSITTQITVLKEPLSVTATNLSKFYGQTAAFPGTGFTTSGLVNGDAVTSATFSSLGAISNAPVSGSPYAIAITNAVGDAGLTNYIITYTIGRLTVNPASLSITANAQIKTYGQTLAFGAGSALFAPVGLQNNETVGSVTLAVSGNGGAATAPTNTYAITPSAPTGGTFNANNYAISYHTGSLTVNPAALSITANAQIKTYGQTLAFGAGSALFTSIGLSNNETIGSVTLAVTGNGGAATAAVGSYTITLSAATGGTFNANNYIIAYNTNTLTVNAAGLTVTASPESKTYGQTVSFGSGSALFTSVGLSNNETIGSVTLAVTGNGGAATAAVGSYTITPSAATGGTFNANNYIIAYNTNTLTVNAAGLTVTASPESKTYGQTVAFGSGSALFTSVGLSNNETIGSVTLAVSGNGGAPAAGAGNYTITPSLATGGSFNVINYTVAYQTNILTVNKAALTITAGNTNKIFGQTVAFAGTEFAAGGLQNSETVGTVSLTSSGAAASAAVGGYNIVPSAPAGGTFAQANYTNTFVAGTLTVTAQPVLTLALSGTNSIMTFSTVTNELYQLQAVTNLTSGTSAAVGGASAGTGGTVSVTNGLPAVTTFYRLKITF